MGNDNLTEAWRDNVVIDYAGVAATELTSTQRQALLDLVALYVDNMDEGHARVKMDEVRAHLDRTYQRPVALRHLMNPDLPTSAHVHTVVRTPNGNDYGKDLLRQHYEQHPHPVP